MNEQTNVMHKENDQTYRFNDVMEKIDGMREGRRPSVGLSYADLEILQSMAKIGRDVLTAKEKNSKAIVQIDAQNKTKVFNNAGQVSDNYHTFDELYHCRHILFASRINRDPEKSWKSKLHHDGTMYDNYFIAGIETTEGQFTFHLPLEYFNLFKCKEIEKAPKWDGHITSDIGRLLNV